MSSKIQEFMKERYGAHLLPLATERAMPGMLLETDWGFGKVTFTREEGYAWEYLGLAADEFSSSLVEANLIQEGINDKTKIGGDISLPQFGLKLSASLESEFQMQIKVTGVCGRTFDKSRAGFDLVQSLLQLKKKNKPLWDWVNDDFLIVESFYVTSFIAQFKGGTGVTAKVAFDKAGQKIEVGVSYEWIGDSMLQVSGLPKVPLAVRGMKI